MPRHTSAPPWVPGGIFTSQEKGAGPRLQTKAGGWQGPVALSCRGGSLHQAWSVLTHLMSRTMVSTSSTSDWSLWKILARGFLV